MVKITSFSLLPQTNRAGTFCRTSFLLKGHDTPNEAETCLGESFFDTLPHIGIFHFCTTTYLLIMQEEL